MGSVEILLSDLDSRKTGVATFSWKPFWVTAAALRGTTGKTRYLTWAQILPTCPSKWSKPPTLCSSDVMGSFPTAAVRGSLEADFRLSASTRFRLTGHCSHF